MKNSIPNITLLDSTLREGKQSILSSLVHNKENAYLEYIYRMGIREIEIANPLSSNYWFSIFKTLIKKYKDVRIFAHTRAIKKDIIGLFNDNLNIKFLSVFLERSNIQIKNQKVILSNSLTEFLEETKSRKLNIRVGIENSFDFSPQELLLIYNKISQKSNLIRIGLLDTYGCLTPDTLLRYAQYMNEKLPKTFELEFHLHNDLGLAAGNFYEILKYFNRNSYNRKIVFSVSLGGIGERNGILSYGEAFAVLYKENKKHLANQFNLLVYGELFNLIFKNNYLLAYRDPLNRNVFTHNATSHIINLINNKQMGSIDPLDFGYSHKILINQSTGNKTRKLINNKYPKINLSNIKPDEI